MDNTTTSSSVGCVTLSSGKLVDLGASELASSNAVLEKNVELSESTVLGLRKTEVGPDDTEAASGKPLRMLAVSKIGNEELTR